MPGHSARQTRFPTEQAHPGQWGDGSRNTGGAHLNPRIENTSNNRSSARPDQCDWRAYGALERRRLVRVSYEGKMHEAILRGRKFTWSTVYPYWPWALVGCAWVLMVLATLTSHSQLIDHDYLLEHSGLPWLVALAVLLTCWQMMTAAMMVPSVLLALHKDAQAESGWSRATEAIFL